MDFIHYTLQWTKGEILEAAIFGTFGLITIIVSFLFWKFGETPNAKALLIPLIVVGIFFAGAGVSGVISNQKRMSKFEKAYSQNPSVFIQNEKERVEGLQYLYTMTLIIATISFVLATGFFWFSGNHILKAIGIALILLGLTGLVIDYFSKERADIYYEKILEHNN